MRTLYLKKILSMNDRKKGGLKGRFLYEEFKRLSEACLLGYMVDTDENAAKLSGHPGLSGSDLLSESAARRFGPDVIFLEGGLFQPPVGGGDWRIPRQLAEELVRGGAVFMVADVDTNSLSLAKQAYREAATFLKAGGEYGASDRNQVADATDGAQALSGHRTFAVNIEEMADFSEWLHPVYDGVTKIVVAGPAQLSGYESLLNAGNRWTTYAPFDTSPPNDFEGRFGCPFASVGRFGSGYVVLIAAGVSDDAWGAEYGGDNVRWLTNVARFLREQREAL